MLFLIIALVILITFAIVSGLFYLDLWLGVGGLVSLFALLMYFIVKLMKVQNAPERMEVELFHSNLAMVYPAERVLEIKNTLSKSDIGNARMMHTILAINESFKESNSKGKEAVQAMLDRCSS